MSAKAFKERYCDSLLDLLWEQWGGLGVASQCYAASGAVVSDPEALLLFSSWFCRYDQRLYDAILDWLGVNGQLLSLPRLKALGKRMTCWHPGSLGYGVSHIQGSEVRRWSAFAEALRPQLGPAEPFFEQDCVHSGSFLWKTDGAGEAYGLLRCRYIPGGKAVAFPRSSAAGFLLQLRGAFGGSSRAEVLLALLHQDLCKVGEIAEMSGFTWKTIQDALVDLCCSGLVQEHRGSGSARLYSLVEPDRLLALFHRRKVRFPNWCDLLEGLGKLWKTMDRPGMDKVSEQTFYNELSQTMKGEVALALHKAGIEDHACFREDKLDYLPKRLAKAL